MAQDIQLTPEQEQILLNTWNKNPSSPPSLKDLTQAVFGHECDGRSAEGRAIKAALTRHNIKAKTAADRDSKTEEIELTEEHKLFITNNASTMSAVEIARELFSNANLSNLNAETRVVNAFIKTLNPHQVVNDGADSEQVPSGPYEPPKSLDKVLRRVNQYIHAGLDRDKLSPSQKKNLNRLIDYLHTFRFVKQINSFDNMDDRMSFEDAFIRYTYDKPDLEQEEVDQYIVLANEVVIANKIHRRGERLERMFNEVTEGEEGAEISMRLTEAMNTAQKEYNECIKRQQSLLGDLKKKRSTKLSESIQENASVLNLFQLWSEEEGRRQMIALGKIEQANVGNEFDKLASFDELKVRIFGLSRDEAING